jgi:methyltransferase (TIGR00027 family)
MVWPRFVVLKRKTSKGVDALISDPYGEMLGGDIGRTWLESLFASSEDKFQDMVTGTAVRTRWIDDTITSLVCDNGFRQVCIVGSGLDARAWRLKFASDLNQKEVEWFELDFPDMIDFKLVKMSEAHAETHLSVRFVRTDMSSPSWSHHLIAQGFDPSRPTLWILEGFTAYLGEAELAEVMERISSLSTSGSRLIATFVGVDSESISLHRFKTNAPGEFMKRFGWVGHQYHFKDLVEGYQRTLRCHKEVYSNYFIVSVEKLQS